MQRPRYFHFQNFREGDPVCGSPVLLGDFNPLMGGPFGGEYEICWVRDSPCDSGRLGILAEPLV